MKSGEYIHINIWSDPCMNQLRLGSHQWMRTSCYATLNDITLDTDDVMACAMTSYIQMSWVVVRQSGRLGAPFDLRQPWSGSRAGSLLGSLIMAAIGF